MGIENNTNEIDNKDVLQDQIIDIEEVDLILNSNQNSEVLNSLLEYKTKDILNGIEDGLLGVDYLSKEDINNYIALCDYVVDNFDVSDKKMDNIYNIIGYKEFDNYYKKIDDRGLLKLSQEQQKEIYDEYVKNKPIFVLLKKSDDEKQEQYKELLKEEYVNHVINKIAKFNEIDEDGKKM